MQIVILSTGFTRIVSTLFAWISSMKILKHFLSHNYVYGSKKENSTKENMKKLVDMCLYNRYDDYNVFAGMDNFKESETKLLVGYFTLDVLFTDCTIQKAHFDWGDFLDTYKRP